MTVLQHSRTPRPEDGIATAAGLDELLAASDVVSLHVPLSAATEKLIGARELALMKSTATLVNTARGGVLDEAALLEALRTKKLHSAGLDVMDGEPRNDVSEALFREPRVTLLPHIGSATDAARAAMVGGALDNLVAVLVNGDEATTPVR
jgi:glyoxylate reductase